MGKSVISAPLTSLNENFKKKFPQAHVNGWVIVSLLGYFHVGVSNLTFFTSSPTLELEGNFLLPSFSR